MRKGTKKLIVAIAAVFAAALLVSLIVIACVPSRTAGRYVDGEDFSGEVMTDETENASHGGHSGWTQITQESFSSGVCTISSGGSYFLSGDVRGQIAVTANGGSSESRAVVNLCLNGHVLDGNGAGTALLIGNVTAHSDSTSDGHDVHTWTPTYVTVNLLDCGGSKTDGVYDNVHYYKRGTAHTLSDGTVVYEGYNFSSADAEGNTVDKDNSDGYVRGGLITGGSVAAADYGGGVTVGYGTELDMYGGTIAGNRSEGDGNGNGGYGGGVMVYEATFRMYGGTVAGNHADTYGGGVCVTEDVEDKGYTEESNASSFYMYGGEVKDNHCADYGGGVAVYGYSDANAHYGYFHMYGGIVEGNYAEKGGGGLYSTGGTSTRRETVFYMYDGATIRDNVSSGPGAGVYLTFLHNCTIAGRITGNRSVGVDGAAGVYCFRIDNSGNNTGNDYRSVITVTGSAYIYGNYANGRKRNFEEDSNRYADAGDITTRYLSYITLGTLTAGARIGVTCASGITRITLESEYSLTSSYLQYFYSDDTAYEVGVNGSGSSSYIQLVAKQK